MPGLDVGENRKVLYANDVVLFVLASSVSVLHFIQIIDQYPAFFIIFFSMER